MSHASTSGRVFLYYRFVLKLVTTSPLSHILAKLEILLDFWLLLAPILGPAGPMLQWALLLLYFPTVGPMLQWGLLLLYFPTVITCRQLVPACGTMNSLVPGPLRLPHEPSC